VQGNALHYLHWLDFEPATTVQKARKMKFTHNEFAHIERTVSKFDTIARVMLASDSTVVADVRALAYIVAELRTIAGLMADEDRSTQQAGVGRMFNLFANMPK